MSRGALALTTLDNPRHPRFAPCHREHSEPEIMSGYVQLERDAEGCLPVPELGLRLCLWQGEYLGAETTWLRWVDNEGFLPLPEEAERARANAPSCAPTPSAAAQTRRRQSCGACLLSWRGYVVVTAPEGGHLQRWLSQGFKP